MACLILSMIFMIGRHLRAYASSALVRWMHGCSPKRKLRSIGHIDPKLKRLRLNMLEHWNSVFNRFNTRYRVSPKTTKRWLPKGASEAELVVLLVEILRPRLAA